jgi:ADP-ribose pyrophosphatase YjhB (NUDIX family)
MGISPYIRRLREKIGDDLLLLPAVSAIVVDEKNRVLLHRASDDGKWYTIGGAMEPGEEPATAAVREAREETGLDVEPIRLVAVQASPAIIYPNGHRVQYVGISFLCRAVGGQLRVADDESLEVRFFSIDELPELRADQLLRVRHALSGDRNPLFTSASAER